MGHRLRVTADSHGDGGLFLHLLDSSFPLLQQE